jgi:glycosyltransferase involved in cell wall biosynthesis
MKTYSLKRKSSNISLVVIGRNESPRLSACFDSIRPYISRVVYVDSGSTDNSRELALKAGVKIVSLDNTQPYTAARARNAGIDFIVKHWRETDFVQFMDGDCILEDEWIDQAAGYLVANHDVAIVTGLRREEFPSKSIYNHFCDIEWGGATGYVSSTGGDFFGRLNVLYESGGFNPTLIAGEEPELCLRLRKTGWKIYRINSHMTLHDANITYFRQWALRTERSGYAYQKNNLLHFDKNFNARVLAAIYFWGLLLPILIVVISLSLTVWAVILLLIYPIKALQLSYRLKDKLGFNTALLYSCSLMLGKFPQVKGALAAVFDFLKRKDRHLIEYKDGPNR